VPGYSSFRFRCKICGNHTHIQAIPDGDGTLKPPGTARCAICGMSPFYMVKQRPDWVHNRLSERTISKSGKTADRNRVA